MKYYYEAEPSEGSVCARIYTRNSGKDDCRYPLHWHNEPEFDLVLGGELIATVGGRQTTVKEGDFFFANSGELHETDAADYRSLRAVTVLISYRLIKEYFPGIDGYYFDFEGRDEAKREIIRLLTECGRVENEKYSLYRLELSVLVRQIVLILLRDCLKSKAIAPGTNDKSLSTIKRTLSFVQHNYTKPLTLAQTAKEIGMAETYFSRYFKKMTGQTFHAYLTNLRLYHACSKLPDKELSVAGIAAASGFSNVKSFIEAFRRKYGTTPEKYRRNADNNK